MAFISLFQPAQLFFFSADSRKSWKLPFLLSEKVLCCFSLREQFNCFQLIIFRLHDCSKPPWCSCQLMLLSRVAEIRQATLESNFQVTFPNNYHGTFQGSLNLCFPKVCTFTFLHLCASTFCSGLLDSSCHSQCESEAQVLSRVPFRGE